ncbi:DeoR/GlpR family DNA-binding transcription regulator [Paenactinomyces guangxiensis]|uniref:DeoR/GlpR transcriptional regulator n=1 Tax=Paenactinomyces guangxiensis TaxID=1490290 RepID=A0A7W1WPP8_9BACL|nr:DeoR/GlpR family DNA-binding transcription regulator [Paenactinomyces guangxiensis]MBA4493791.1 DeoR/GlpR transcriptional regulator [Paenactinomyces guangxiensis]MBH8591080.1 DeoR/GlpR transcriptional regulator [Paenactinomyces guangxiensis]
MLVAERQQKILDLVNQRGSIRVSELSQIFQVTEETIRRDLDHLEKRGKLRRSHGGAVSIKKDQPEIPYFEREILNVQEKREIAKQALKYITSGDRIILDASTTAWYMAKILPDIPLTVLTNSIKVAMELSGKEKIEVISTGGILLAKSLSYVGPLAERSLDLYHVNKAFISCKGVHPQHGISESNEMQSLVKQRMINIADQTFLLADYSKFGVRAFAQLAAFDQIFGVITDSKTDYKYIQQLEELSVEVIQV